MKKDDEEAPKDGTVNADSGKIDALQQPGVVDEVEDDNVDNMKVKQEVNKD